MKPIKNRYYCNGCSRVKMLFKTEEKALNFIKYNSEEIFNETGVAPIRAYYCQYCGGWHVTSSAKKQTAPFQSSSCQALYFLDEGETLSNRVSGDVCDEVINTLISHLSA